MSEREFTGWLKFGVFFTRKFSGAAQASGQAQAPAQTAKAEAHRGRSSSVVRLSIDARDEFAAMHEARDVERLARYERRARSRLKRATPAFIAIKRVEVKRKHASRTVNAITVLVPARLNRRRIASLMANEH